MTDWKHCLCGISRYVTYLNIYFNTTISEIFWYIDFKNMIKNWKFEEKDVKNKPITQYSVEIELQPDLEEHKDY